MSILAITPRAKDMNTASMTESSLQLMLDLEKVDLAMFESLIELDFCEVYNEHAMIYIGEAEQEQGKQSSFQALKTKISTLIRKILENIKAAFKAFSDKMTEVFNRDKQTYAKYKDDFFKNCKSCTVKGFKIPDFDNVEIYLGKKNADSDMKMISELADLGVQMAEASGNNDVDGVNKIAEKVAEIQNQRLERIKNLKIEDFFIDKSKLPLGQAIQGNEKDIASFMEVGLKEAIKNFKDLSDQAYKNTKEQEKFLNKAVPTNGAAQVYLKKLQEAINKDYTYFSTLRTFVLSMIRAVYANIRKIFITCANGVQETTDNAGNKQETPVNASYLMNIGTMSDMYVEEAFTF